MENSSVMYPFKMTEPCEVVCFGETLWDMLPGGKVPGGAPMNVAVHLSNLGVGCAIISRLGQDTPGDELEAFLSEKKIQTTYLQRDSDYPTGRVIVKIEEDITYMIDGPVAWDFILYSPDGYELIEKSRFFVFCSLALRSEESFNTLKSYFPAAQTKVFDINLRPPHYSWEKLTFLLLHTDILKLNYQELEILSDYFFQGPESAEDKVKALSALFYIETVCVTLGESGALLLHNSQFYKQAGFPVTVTDTVGSGDAFLGAFLSALLQNVSAENALKTACAVGAFVATQKGGTPFYTLQEIDEFMHQYS